MTDQEEIHKRTLALMNEGARIEAKKFNQLQKAREMLKSQLEVIFIFKNLP